MMKYSFFNKEHQKHIAKLHDKHAGKVDLNKEKRIVHICFIVALVLAVVSLFITTSCGLIVSSNNFQSLNLSGKFMGFYAFDANNHPYLHWVSYLDVVIILLMAISLAIGLLLEHEWKFKLSKHKLTYFCFFPFCIFAFFLFIILISCGIPTQSVYVSPLGGVYSTFSSLLTRFIVSPDGVYSNIFTPFGWIMLFFIIFFICYQVKVTTAYIYETFQKWGSNNKYIYNKNNATAVLLNKKRFMFNMCVIDIVTMPVIILFIYAILFSSPIHFDAASKITIMYVFLPFMCLVFIGSSIALLVWINIHKHIVKRYIWFDILAIGFGGIGAMIGGTNLLTDYWYVTDLNKKQNVN